MVTKLLDRSQMSDPKAVEAIQQEGTTLVDAGTWLEDTVTERQDLLADAKKTGKKIHWGDILTLCSIKFFEKHASFRRYKGRICFRGDNVKDEDGAPAVFQEMSSSPAAIQSVNANVAYGLIPGHKSTVSDALSAYLQSSLKSKYPTWVTIPKTLWPKHWHGKYHRPMCLLAKALYGHPESGGHWEKHLTEAVTACGGKPVPEHPSSYFFESEKLLLTVYVDDLLLSGPTQHHDKFWERLRAKVSLGQPEPLDRFLGRDHTLL